ncbi:MAG TPA: beta-ketoacyl synthase N-terminal-like domain-containing protein [Chitinophaga sp.]|uniref:beta-ketoacyl synthase N-terminal-like domain-containing protein n=1 Tax=Chitinophaga sp. TaxID=1869181 RepID=UPI002BA949C7|nr:beta-ketoacyl synthase N-terminal-like domain-containing protein [Chitinophaga sp.]HVI47463.1 beta-ketoacyl synthase N-terminal-like domain-containing protein [Chitinophaga sp.]
MFFEYPNLKELATYFAAAYPQQLRQLSGGAPQQQVEDTPQSLFRQRKRFFGKTVQQEPVKAVTAPQPSTVQEQIAIIGISGRYPMADNLHEFWENLKAGKNCVEAIPEDRWDNGAYYDTQKHQPGKIRSQWGGFIKDADKFDPLFFNISPLEAQLTDPQERIFLQTVWHTLEDAGYTRQRLSGKQVGVFAGVMYGEYQLYNAGNKNNAYVAASSYASVANRVSYFFNFHGPSIAVDTMCSSSLTAIHLACNSILLKECELAVAGGVNLTVHPHKYQLLSQSDFISAEGKCNSFGEGGEGYIPGEGVGAVLLKPLSQAIADRDHIYGVIKGSALNHGGKTNGYTVPNPATQANVIRQALEQAKVEPRTVTYIEAHGTGTALGDPVEIEGLTRSFGDVAALGQFCAIGSAKSNIGHLESAAGIASLSKVLLQMKHGQLAPSIHAEKINPNISFNKTPFYLQQTTSNWVRPLLRDDTGHEKLYPRIAGISSFGAGGSNAHLVIEEYPARLESAATQSIPVFVLSAKNKERLKEYAQILHTYLLQPGNNFHHVLYTLQTGREALQHRVAWVAGSERELLDRLEKYVRGNYSADEISGSSSAVTAGLPAEAGQWQQLAATWAAGADIDWSALYKPESRPLTVSLPGYPFTKERYWITDLGKTVPEITETGKRHADTPAVIASPAVDILALFRHDIAAKAAALIQLPQERLEPERNLGEYGYESTSFVQLSEQINHAFGLDITPAVFFEKQSVLLLSAHLLEEHPEAISRHYRQQAPAAAAITQGAGAPVSSQTETAIREVTDIAIIGMNGRFPQSPDLDAYWQQLEAAADLITEVPEDRWNWKDFESEYDEGQAAGRWGGFIRDADKFDARFFNISPREAETMDPQQRVFLEGVWHTIEDAGYRAADLAGRHIGIFAGVQFQDYQYLLITNGENNAQMGLGNELSILVNRASYLLNFHGPSEPYNTACSSALVAVHRAIDSIRRGECEMALAGGVTLMLNPYTTVSAATLGILSPDGRCKTLDTNANGYVRGEGIGLVLLKPLEKAKADGDHIYAVIKGSAVNHGGKASSLTAPNAAAQADLIVKAHQQAGFDPATVSYLELHGTGTKLGDPVEIEGIKSAFKKLARQRPATGEGIVPYCGVGTVKTNIGHLEPVSGIAGLLKVVLAMQHKTLPGIVNLKTLNPFVKIERSPFYIVSETKPWQALTDAQGRELPRRAGVSSFGFGGVNAHVALEEYIPATPAAGLPFTPRLFVWSAKNEERLKTYVTRWLDFIREKEGAGAFTPLYWHQVAYTLAIGREEMDSRLAVVADCPAALAAALNNYLEGLYDINVLSGSVVAYKQNGGVAATVTAVDESADYLSLADAWLRGAVVPWQQLFPQEVRKRVPLPVYPFERKRYWLTPRVPLTAGIPVIARQQEQAVVSETTASAEMGREHIVRELKSILADKLKVAEEDVNGDDDLAELGMDSIFSLIFMQAIQDRYGQQISLSAAVEHPTINRLAAYVHNELLDSGEMVIPSGNIPAARPAAKKNTVTYPPELIPINTSGTQPISFWFHPATGFATLFKNVSDALGPDYPLYGLQARGTDGKTVPQTFDEMVEHYLKCIRMVQPHGPYVLCAYSFGGLIAVAVSKRLEEEGEKIRHLFLLETFPTTEEVNNIFLEHYDFDFLKIYLANFFLKVADNPELTITRKDIAGISPRLHIGHICKLVKERARTMISMDDIFNYIRGGLICSDYSEEAYRTYRIDSYSASDVTFVKTKKGFIGKDNFMNWPALDLYAMYDYVAPWRGIVTNKLELVEVDSDHFEMLNQPQLQTIIDAIKRVFRTFRTIDETAYTAFADGFGSLTTFLQALLLKRFREQGLLQYEEESYTMDDIITSLSVQPSYHALLAALLDILQRRGWISIKGAVITVTAEAVAPELEALADQQHVLEENQPEDIKGYVPLLLACLENIFEVMAGRRKGTDVIFPEGSDVLVGRLYNDNIQARFYNEIVEQYVADIMIMRKQQYPNSVINICEIGAGSGSGNEGLLPVLKNYAQQVRYLYTDSSKGIVSAGERKLREKYPFVDFKQLDIQKSVERQGFEPGSMNVVIAGNMLQGVRNVATAIKQVHGLLKPGGAFVINQITRLQDYNTVTFGLTEGWWQFEDGHVRIPHSPLLQNTTLRDILEANGFEQVEILGIPGVPTEELEQSVVVAVKKSDV